MSEERSGKSKCRASSRSGVILVNAELLLRTCMMAGAAFFKQKCKTYTANIFANFPWLLAESICTLLDASTQRHSAQKTNTWKF